MSFLNYRNILTVLIVLTVWATLFIVDKAIVINADKNRYEIENCQRGLVLLVDKKTGLVWRNVWDNSKDKIPSAWSLMTYSGAVVPEGEQAARDFRAKSLWAQFGKVKPQAPNALAF